MINKTTLPYSFIRFGLLLLFLFSSFVHAQDSESGEKSIPVPSTLEEATKQRELADQIKNKAEEQYRNEQNECHRKFLVNDCLDDAKKRYTEKIVYARRLETPAIAFQREVRRAKSDEKQAQREADLERRQEEEEKQIQEFRDSEAKKSAEREKRTEDKARKAEEQRKKIAQDQARRQEKQAQRAKKDAERAAKKAKRASEEKSP